MAEFWDVRDAHGVKLGRLHERGTPMREGEYHLSVTVWIANSRGEFLISKRAPAKNSPNMWEPTGGGALAGEEIPPLPPLAQRCDTAVRQFEINAAHKGEKVACLEARRHYAWYLKGVPYAGYYKEQISKISTMEDIYKVTEGIKRDLR